MFSKNRKENSKTAIVFNNALVLLLLFGTTAMHTFGQTNDNAQSATTLVANEKNATPVLMPVLTTYKEIKIGTLADEVREKLGKAEIDDKDGFFYKFSDEEFAQIRLDKDKKVRLIAITYSGENKNAPKYADVFGSGAEAAAKPDGSIYNLVRYRAAGYWVAYSRTAGENSTVTVTMQKM